MTALPVPTSLSVLNDETGNSLTASALLTDDTLSLRFYYGYEFASDWIGYVERVGSGSKQITSLEYGKRYQVSAVSVDSDSHMSAPVIPVIEVPTMQKTLNRDDRKHMTQFIRHLLRRAIKYRWYAKKTDNTDYPSTMVNIPFIEAPVAENVLYNENVRVVDQVSLFQDRGLIPVVRQRTGGLNKADIGFAQVKFGDFTAFCPIDYTVDIDDRLVNSQTGEEYRVVHSTPHENGLYRHLEMKLLRV